MARVPANPSLISWACERSGEDRKKLEEKFKDLPAWEAGNLWPTAAQLKQFAQRVHVPYSYLFLEQPPEKELPIADFRTIRSEEISKLSPNLLDIIYSAQNRQDWYRGFAESEQLPNVNLIASTRITSSPVQKAREMRNQLEFDLAKSKPEIKKMNRLRYLINSLEKQGILVMVSGVVDSNTHRTLDPKEFRGFALCDPIAPLIFVNGQDSETAQLFTLAHEFGHLLLGATGISNSGLTTSKSGKNKSEVWCNKFAAEFLVPLEELKNKLTDEETIENSLNSLSRYYRVSKLVILYRLFELQQITQSEYDKFRKILNVEVTNKKTGKGGDLILTTRKRVGQKFAFAIIDSTLKGQTLYRDAFRMLGISKIETFDKLTESVGVKV